MKRFLFVVIAWLLCPGLARAACLEGASLSDLQQHIDVAQDLYFRMKYDDARHELNEGLEGLVCTSDVVPSNDLHRLHLLLGALQLVRKQDNLARDTLARAIAIAPQKGWDSLFGEKGEAVYLAVRSTMKLEPRIPVEVTRLPADISLAVDGESIASESPGVELVAGEHFVQMRTGGGVWAAQWVLVPALQRVRLELVGADLFALPFLEPPAVSSVKQPVPSPESTRVRRPRAGPFLIGAFGLLTVAAGGSYLYGTSRLESGACLDTDTCDAVWQRATVAYAATWGMASATLVSAAYTWILPRLELRHDKRAVLEPKAQLGLRPNGVRLGLSMDW